MLPDPCASAQAAFQDTASSSTSPECGLMMRKPTFQSGFGSGPGSGLGSGPESLQITISPVAEIAAEAIPEASGDEDTARSTQQQQQQAQTLKEPHHNSLSRTVSMPHGPHRGAHVLRTRTTTTGASAREKVTKRYAGGQLPQYTDHLSPTSEMAEDLLQSQELDAGRDRTLSVASHASVATTEGSEIDSDQERAGREKDKSGSEGKEKSGGRVMGIFRRLSQKVGKSSKRPERAAHERDSDSDASKASNEHLQPQHVRFHMESGEHLDVPQQSSIVAARHSPMLLPPRQMSDDPHEATRTRRLHSMVAPPNFGVHQAPESDSENSFKGVPRTNRSPSSSFLQVSSSSTGSGNGKRTGGGFLAFLGIDSGSGSGDKFHLEVHDLTTDSASSQSCRTFRNAQQFLDWHRSLYSKQLQQSFSSHVICAHDVDVYRAAGFTPSLSLTKSHTAHPSLLKLAAEAPQNTENKRRNSHSQSGIVHAVQHSTTRRPLLSSRCPLCVSLLFVEFFVLFCFVLVFWKVVNANA